VNRDDWYLRVPTVLWADRTICKKLAMQTPFNLVYGIEVVALMEHLVPSLRIVSFTDMNYTSTVRERLAQSKVKVNFAEDIVTFTGSK
jgi:hypothetical protein